jgi:hypothetical protein
VNQEIKVLGVAVAAVLALGALGTPATYAAAGILTTEIYPATLTENQVGKSEWVMGIGSRKVSCAVWSTHGISQGPQESSTLVPRYENCTSTNGLPATIITKQCHYQMRWERVEVTTGTTKLDLFCPSGQEVTIDIFANAEKQARDIEACEFHIRPQVEIALGEYHLEGNGTTRNVATTSSGATFHTVNTVGSKLLCGLKSGETGTSTIKGTRALIAESPESNLHAGAFIS